MQRKFGLDMQLPDGKLPGFYAQIVKGIADRALLFDRHKELLVFDRREDVAGVLELLDHYKVKAEPCELLWAPVHAVVRTGRFEDFAVETREGNVFFDLAYSAGFRLLKKTPEAEPAPALQQLEEHIIADVSDGGAIWHFIERQLTELADRVAEAYHCGTEWLDAESL